MAEAIARSHWPIRLLHDAEAHQKFIAFLLFWRSASDDAEVPTKGKDSPALETIAETENIAYDIADNIANKDDAEVPTKAKESDDAEVPTKAKGADDAETKAKDSPETIAETENIAAETPKTLPTTDRLHAEDSEDRRDCRGHEGCGKIFCLVCYPW